MYSSWNWSKMVQRAAAERSETPFPSPSSGCRQCLSSSCRGEGLGYETLTHPWKRILPSKTHFFRKLLFLGIPNGNGATRFGIRMCPLFPAFRLSAPTISFTPHFGPPPFVLFTPFTNAPVIHHLSSHGPQAGAVTTHTTQTLAGRLLTKFADHTASITQEMSLSQRFCEGQHSVTLLS